LVEVEEEPKIVAIDGKTSRGSKRNKTDRDAVTGMHTGMSLFDGPGVVSVGSGGRRKDE
jgi:hypothetical protein